MPVVNVRVDEHVHEQLKELADASGKSLSEFVRDRLLEVVRPVRPDAIPHGDQPAPTTLPLFNRQVLSMLHRILGRVLPEDGTDSDGGLKDQLELAEVLEHGYTAEYWTTVAGFRTELSDRDCEYVIEILQMFRMITYSVANLAREGTPVNDELAFSLRFRGFDHNDPLEAHMARYVEFLMRGGDRWTELKPQVDASDGGNAHARMLSIYLRMLNEYRRLMDARDRGFGGDDYLLSTEELERIAAERVHPSNRSIS